MNSQTLKGKVIENLFGRKGYATNLELSKNDLEAMRSLVVSRYIDLLSSSCPDIEPSAVNHGPQYYHNINLGDRHKEVFCKSNRMLSNDLTDFKQLDFYKRLKSVFGDGLGADEELILASEFYWRIIRPNEPTDVGPIHADSWFWTLQDIKPPDGKTRVKVWFSLFSEPGKSGLMYLEGSHLMAYEYSGEIRDGLLKPQPSFDSHSLPMVVFDGPPGQAFIFNEDLLHGGLVGGDLTRVSIEFYLVANTEALQLSNLS